MTHCIAGHVIYLDTL